VAALDSESRELQDPHIVLDGDRRRLRVELHLVVHRVASYQAFSRIVHTTWLPTPACEIARPRRGSFTCRLCQSSGLDFPKRRQMA
jgi:hypothetical protein